MASRESVDFSSKFKVTKYNLLRILINSGHRFCGVGQYYIEDKQESQLSHGMNALKNKLCVLLLAGQYERGEFSA